MFRLKASNNKIIMISEGYKTKQGCMKGIEAVKQSITNVKVNDKT